MTIRSPAAVGAASGTAPDVAYYKEQSQRCYWLASQSDKSLARSLRVMALEYELRAVALQRSSAPALVGKPPAANDLDVRDASLARVLLESSNVAGDDTS